MHPLHHWIDTADPLHFGNFAGLWSKALWFVAGLGLSGHFLTGAYLQAKRQQRTRMTAYRGPVLAAYGYILLILLASAWFGYHELLTYGTGGGLPSVPPGAVLVIFVFVLSTLAILTAWARALR